MQPSKIINIYLNTFLKISFFTVLLFSFTNLFSQNNSKMIVDFDSQKNILSVNQEITYKNQSNDTLNSIILNDWNNAYSSKTSLLAERFSDEFIRSFHLAAQEERGNTNIISVQNETKSNINWKRCDNQVDLIQVEFPNKIAPNQSVRFNISYQVKIPSNQFTKYGYAKNGDINLTDWFLAPARFENHTFTKYSNANIDDIANTISNYEITVNIPENLSLVTDLDLIETSKNEKNNSYKISGNNRNSFLIFLETKSKFRDYKNDEVTVVTDLEEKKLDEIQKAIIINRIAGFTNQNIGKYPFDKILISKDDYSRNPFYGLNQLPSFLSPFHDDFLFEIKFLKSYLNAYLKNSLHLDPRKDNWIYDGIQVYFMMKYMDENYPESKMMGSVAKLKILKSFHLINLDFNEQFSYFSILMSRKNLDQTISNPKNTLIKYNEKIAGKYRAGLSLKYLDNYLNENKVQNAIQQFWQQNAAKETTNQDFVNLLKTNANKNIDWFFDNIINFRKIIDYKFTNYSKTKDSVTFTIKNKTQTQVPISVYGLKNKTIVFQKWLENIKTDSTFTLPRNNANKIVINYKNEVPEYNLRNNWKKLGGIFPNNRPIKFVFMKDLEDPKYNQVLYVPAFNYNLYDGVTVGMRFHNKTILDKPFTFDIEPLYATNTQSLTGSFSLALNQNIREGKLYFMKYGISSSTSHYAPDASYQKLTPYLSFNFRETDFRKNKKESLLFRQIIVNREESIFFTTKDTQKYSIFDARFGSNDTQITKQFRYSNDLQISGKFGKLSGNIEYRKLFENNQQLNLRFFAGTFLYRKTNSDFFSFALDRPTDYLFDYNYIGRSETTGIFSQQLIIAEAGFKTKLNKPFANQWITAVNGSTNIWNWIEVYGDAAVYKNQFQNPKFVFDSGIRLNLVTDYFELYLPVYSSNGWDISKNNYNEKIRFIVTLSTNTLTSLFTRKWF